tara:strand:- start:164 stop:352 length:189 start_codon:yes stop_codon:yes gene_type:complete
MELLDEILIICGFFCFAFVCAWLYIEFIKCKFRIIFSKPAKVQPAYVVAEPVFQTTEIAVVV